MEQQSAAPPAARAIVDFLRDSKTGPKTRVGQLNGKRADHFKGTGAVKALLSPAYVKAQTKKGSVLPPIKDEDQAQEVLHSVIPYAFFLRVDRAESGPKERALQINQMQMFKQEYYYAWLYDGSQLLLQLSGFGMILLMLAGVMFPLWPASMRVGVWYLSIGVLGLLGAFFGLAVVRLIFWCISLVILRPGVWIFPNLFEDVGFVDSFIPLWAWDVPAPKKKKKASAAEGRAAVANLPGQEAASAPKVASAPEAAQAAPTKPAEGNVKQITKPSEKLADLD